MGINGIVERNQVAVLHYGGHVKIAVGETAYSGFCWITDQSSYKECAERAAKIGRQSFLKFDIRVSDAEFEKLKKFIDAQPESVTCMGLASKVLAEGADLKIPFPINYLPAHSGVYLMGKYLYGNERIKKVSLIGHSVQIRQVTSTLRNIFFWEIICLFLLGIGGNRVVYCCLKPICNRPRIMELYSSACAQLKTKARNVATYLFK